MADYTNLENEGKDKAKEEMDTRLGENKQQPQPNDPNYDPDKDTQQQPDQY